MVFIPYGGAVALFQGLGDPPGVVGQVALIEAQILPLIPLRVGDHLDLPFATGRTREPTVSSQNRLIPPRSRLPAESRQNILHGGAVEDLFDDVEDRGDGQADLHRHSRPARLRLLGFVNSGV